MAFELKTFGGFNIHIDDARELQRLIFDEQVRPEDQLRDLPTGRWMTAREHPQASPIFQAFRDQLAKNAKSAFLASGTAIAPTHQDDGQPIRPDWHVKFAGRSLGPLPEDRLIDMISRGEVPHDAQLYASGSMKWRPLSDVESLRAFLPLAVLPQAPPQPKADKPSSIVISGFGPKTKPASPAPSPTASASLLPSLPDDLKQFVIDPSPRAAQPSQPRERTLMRPNPTLGNRPTPTQQQRQLLILVLALSSAILVLAVILMIALL